MAAWMDDDLTERRRSGLFRQRRRLESGQGTRVTYRGRELINFGSNDYLDLARDRRLARAAARAVRRWGCGSGASPLVSGYVPPLRRLEKTLAAWQGTEAAPVFSSGFLANLAAVATLAGRHDGIFSDALNHASLIDGCRLSRARVHVYRHADATHLEELLRAEGHKARRRLIVTDTVFSMDGDIAPLPALVQLAERYDCILAIDEAHASGVLGANGRGAMETLPSELTIDADRIVKVGTLSKALGSQGGFVSGSRQLRDWLVNYARPYIFSTALAVPAAAAAQAAVHIVQAEPERRQKLDWLASTLRSKLQSAGYPVPNGCTPIIPFIVGEAGAASAFSNRLEAHGLLVPAIRPPSVPAGTARLRISLTAGHTTTDIEMLVDALCRTGA
ncbi:MAG TPA: 8-amino-7-oxononanoate synthase [Gemmataceae bacterium]|nr:8-amino-7-oxononanoate synthase [Gemmataceae bacterium]